MRAVAAHRGLQVVMLSRDAVVLLQDMLDLVDVEGKREPGKYPTKQGGFDLIWDNGPVQQFDRPTSLPTMLGCYNYRDQNQTRRSLSSIQAEEGSTKLKYSNGGIKHHSPVST